MEYSPVRVSDIIRQVNGDIYLPAIQREFVWGTDRIERLFDSIMADFPIGSFLFWKLEQKNKDEWPVYEFIREFDAASPHNPADDIALRAYQKYVDRGGEEGHHCEDWLSAEREILAEIYETQSDLISDDASRAH